MALYKHDTFLKKSLHPAFDKKWEPGEVPDYPGIYSCFGCRKEVTVAETHKLPPQNHHQHRPEQGKIAWRLIVLTQTE